MKNILSIILLIIPATAFSQSYKDWDDHDIQKIYQKQELPYDSINEEGEEIKDVYIPSKIKDGTYKVELVKLSSKFYQIRGTNIYILFRYTPYLYSYDEGVMDISYNSGTFYKKP